MNNKASGKSDEKWWTSTCNGFELSLKIMFLSIILFKNWYFFFIRTTELIALNIIWKNDHKEKSTKKN